MTAKDQQKMRRLEIENAELRAQIEKHMSVYRESLYQIVEMKTKLQLIDMAMSGGDDAGS